MAAASAQDTNRVEAIDPFADSRWDAMVASHRYGTLFHQSDWGRVLQASFGYQPRFFGLVRNGDLTGGLASYLVRSWITGRRLVAAPFADYCDPLVSHPDELVALVSAAQAERRTRKAKSLEFRIRRGMTPEPEGREPVCETGYQNHLLDLGPGLGPLRKSCSRHIRRNLQRAEASGLEVITGDAEDDLRRFYALFLATRKKQGLLPQPYQFFHQIWATYRVTGSVLLTLAHKGEETVAGGIGVLCGDTYYALYAASNAQYLELRPNHLIRWEEFRWAIERGLRYYDFGRTSLRNEGLIRFKEGWGAEAVGLAYYRYAEAKQEGHSLLQVKTAQPEWVKTVTRAIPSPLLQLASGLLYRHLG